MIDIAEFEIKVHPNINFLHLLNYYPLVDIRGHKAQQVEHYHLTQINVDVYLITSVRFNLKDPSGELISIRLHKNLGVYTI